MESCINCSCDFLALYDGIQSNATLLQNLCNFSPGKVHSTGTIMRVEFVADPIGTDFGFQLNFTAVPATSLLSTFSSLRTTTPTTRWPPSTTASAAACQLGVTNLHAALNSKGRIYSPGYPYNYPHNSNCQWRISADQGNVIHLVVREVSIENCSTCTCDKVVMYDGPSSSARLLYGLCMTIQANYSVDSTGPNMFITFTSDSSVSGKGFVLEYWAVLDRGGIYLQASTSETKTIYYTWTSVNYPNYANSSWLIRADDGYVVQLSVLNVDIEQCTNCICDKLQIFDAPAYSEGRRIRQYCGSLRSDVVYTTQKYAFLTFTSDSSRTGKGFTITYRAVTYDPAFYQTTKRTTSSIEVYQTSPGRPTYSKDQTTGLVMIIVGSLTGLSILFIFVVLIIFLVKRRQARSLNTYSNLPHTGNTVTVTSTTVPPMHYYQPNTGVVVAVPGVVYPAQSAPPAFRNEAFTPDLIPSFKSVSPSADRPVISRRLCAQCTAGPHQKSFLDH
ncbi:tolloid-like protein 2 [Pomacea canaliculata]|uniref:tolloid-like protein 2 n=1 Tax=Pomacea canaliculata TaxID=400727 RepID=UPI000D73E27B|nr:tolloid-like protein 2 [Pomacea canaliculata]